ncbi:N-acetylmuramic acid 6-phosphate etherase [Mycoplasma leonicaptivi]|uniref:N-acetylmuramic acid 6-phosphate etherase n=1 Tax=Mycoplasma leonicaptivi TaxID=36742 RepID=UPI000489CC69|nr:N-acetylmuramic acid 6-phosphate etherase [Mycoplasma leonicaptivi]
MKNKQLDQLNYHELFDEFNYSFMDVQKEFYNLKNLIIELSQLCVNTIKNKGRVFYVGAGTSGRIAMLDSLDILPTFGEYNWFKYAMAGGQQAILKSLEGYEDDFELGKKDAKKFKINQNDLIIGLSASGNTRYVNGFFVFAKEVFAKTVLISNQDSGLCLQNTDLALISHLEPEIIDGSTRLKSATLQKMILNTISSTTAIKLGKVYNNYMIDLTPINEKLVKRSINIIQKITNLSFEDANNLYKKANKNIKIAIIMFFKQVDFIDAKKLLKEFKNNLRDIIG